MTLEVVDCARKAWGYEERGENYYGGVVTCSSDILSHLSQTNPDALVLLIVSEASEVDNLAVKMGVGEEAVVANAM